MSSRVGSYYIGTLYIVWVYLVVNGSWMFQQPKLLSIDAYISTPLSVITSILDWVSLTSEDKKNVPEPSIKPFWNNDLFCNVLVFTHDSLMLAKAWKYNFRSFFIIGPKQWHFWLSGHYMLYVLTIITKAKILPKANPNIPSIKSKLTPLILKWALFGYG